MKRDIWLWQLTGFSFTSLAGTLLHFLYEWTGESILAAPFSGVNESTWEHMKLLYFPLLLFAFVQRLLWGRGGIFWCVKLVGTVSGLLTIPLLFYTYNGAIGKSPDALNIAIFFISAAVAFTVEWALFKKDQLPLCAPRLSFALLILTGILFIVFTFAPPLLPIFKDPLSASYGIEKGLS